MLNLANQITIGRIVLNPIILIAVVYASPDSHITKYLAFGLFVIAALTDALDGWIARNRNQVSTLGSILDPFADKLLILSVIVALQVSPHYLYKLPDWVFLVIIFRDGLMIATILIFLIMKEPLKIKPNQLGKVTTVLQMVTVGLLLLECETVIYLAILTGIITGISGIVYFFSKLGGITHNGSTE